MSKELSKTYDPAAFEPGVTKRWLDAHAFDADPDDRPASERYVIMMPLPNVTGALHMGHAMDNVMQDLLIRWHRMLGDTTLWQPGTDHAGIATQAVVEKRLFELEGKTRHDIGREGLVQRIWSWKDEYEARIIRQQQAMGCSADWRRQRFTMDAVCSRAVREAFFRLFRDGLIFRGNRLVNWDVQLQTAVADDEVYHDTVAGHFWHLKYPVIDPKPGEPEFVIVATTRPETMLGDTAVACHPSPRAALQARIDEQKQRLAEASAKEKEAEQAELARLEARVTSHLPQLEQLVEMAKDGRQIRLPLLDREIPLIADEWAKPELGSGCVKITPAHDANDYDVWSRHHEEIGLINILNPDGTLNAAAGPYAGQDRFDARKSVVADLKKQGLLDTIEDREVEVGHSDRSKTPIEPYLSKQWFVRMGDVEGGVTCAAGTDREFQAPGLAQAAIDAVAGNDYFPTEQRLAFHPTRYAGQYQSWLAEKRDWCISRQLWWGHQIPVWMVSCTSGAAATELVQEHIPDGNGVSVWVTDPEGHAWSEADVRAGEAKGPDGEWDVMVCLRSDAADEEWAAALEAEGLQREQDVLDTWFSSALWPFSTLGWPDPATAPIKEGQVPLAARDDHPDAFHYFYPGSCLATSRDIITLWVARMVIAGLYNHGVVPFTDCFVHCKILDGKGVTMSKSKGNGVDPFDIIERYGTDAMRYLICDIETGMQDVRLPVQAECPSCQKVIELSEASHGQTIFTWVCTHCGKELDVLGTMDDVPKATVFSERFENGRKFCNKLWNVTRFVLMNMDPYAWKPLEPKDLAPEDRWILSRLALATQTVTGHLADYKPSAALNAARDFVWNELCDWYVEFTKARMSDPEQATVARQVLATALDQSLRLLHPFLPFITEALWETLGGHAPQRGIDAELDVPELCMSAAWPTLGEAWRNDALDTEFGQVNDAIYRFREMRSAHNVPPRKEIPGAVVVSGDVLAILNEHRTLIQHMANLSSLEAGPDVERPANAATSAVGEMEFFLGDVVDPDKERARLEGQRGKLEKQIEGAKKKLGNQGFVAKAPPAVVQAERDKLGELEGQLETVLANLKALG